MKSKKPYFTIIKSDLGREAVLAEDYADLIERHAKMLKHAEAMADVIENPKSIMALDVCEALHDAIAAYRADFPKE